MSSSTKSLMWAAGFLEGEGSFTLTSSLQVAASQKQKWPLKKLQSIFGGAVRPRSAHDGCYVWYLYGHGAAAVMMTLFVLLSPRRQKQICKALARWKKQAVTQRLRNTCPLGHLLKPRKGRRYCPTCAAKSHAIWLERRKNADRPIAA